MAKDRYALLFQSKVHVVECAAFSFSIVSEMENLGKR